MSLPVTAEVCHPLDVAQPSFATCLDLPVPDEPPQQTVDESLDLFVSDEATPGPDEATQLMDTAFHLELSSPADSGSVGIPPPPRK